MSDITETIALLRGAAEKATPGPWCWEAHGQKSNDWTVGYAEDDNGVPLEGEIREPDSVIEAVGNSEPWILRKRVVIEQEDSRGFADAALIAAANPATILALCDAAERAERLHHLCVLALAPLDYSASLSPLTGELEVIRSQLRAALLKGTQ